jgi:signal peptidase I
MSFDFPTLLVIATFATGGIWLVDAVAFAPARRRALEEGAVEPKGEGEDRTEPLMVEYARSFFPVILIVLLLRSFLVEPFRIPSGSMMPTLLIGDFILVNKFAYGIRLPVLNKKIISTGEPQRGDVVVFRYPKDQSVDYIKRVIGVPGDHVEYKNKTLSINGEKAPQVLIGRYKGSGSGKSMTGNVESLETIDELEHAILINQRRPDFSYSCQFLGQDGITVPEGHYFVMGDNRDHSSDSRCWGLVPEENLAGEAFGIWMSWDGNRSDFPIAWERLGNGIQ